MVSINDTHPSLSTKRENQYLGGPKLVGSQSDCGVCDWNKLYHITNHRLSFWINKLGALVYYYEEAFYFLIRK